MNHPIFGQSKPVVYATRGVAGAVALPIVVGVGAVAGTAFLTYQGGRLAHKAHKKRQRRKQIEKRLGKQFHKSFAGSPLTAGKESAWRASLLLPGTLPKVVIPKALDMEISLVLLKGKVQSLGEQIVSVGIEQPTDAKFKLISSSYKQLSDVANSYQQIEDKHRGLMRDLALTKKCAINTLKDGVCEATGTMMLQLTDACCELKDTHNDGLNPRTAFERDDSKTDACTVIAQADVTALFSHIQGLLPTFLENLSCTKYEATQYEASQRNRARMRGARLLLHLLVSSGLNPSAYVQELVFSFYKKNQQGIDAVILEWFKLIRHYVEGDSLEWLAAGSWLHKISLETWDDFTGSPKLLPDTAKLLDNYYKIKKGTAQLLARHCIGAVLLHNDLVYQCKIGGFEGGHNTDLFDGEIWTNNDQTLLLTAQQFEQAANRPFATGCMLQYLTSRHQTRFDFDMSSGKTSKSRQCTGLKTRQSRHSLTPPGLSPDLLDGATGSSPYTENDILETVCCALSVIYDSSHLSYLRAMCFRYVQMVFQLELGIERVSTLAASHLDFDSLGSTDIPQKVNEATPTFQWKQLFKKMADGCLAVMLHQSMSLTKTAVDKWEQWLLPSACGCLHSMYCNARVLLYLAGENGETIAQLRSSVSMQKAEDEARNVMIGLCSGSVDKALLRKLSLELLGAAQWHVQAQRSFDHGQRSIIHSAQEWTKKMIGDQEWLVIEKQGAQYFVSFDGKVRSEPPRDYTVAWKISAGDAAWIHDNSWVKANFPMLTLKYYVQDTKANEHLRKF